MLEKPCMVFGNYSGNAIGAWISIIIDHIITSKLYIANVYIQFFICRHQARVLIWANVLDWREGQSFWTWRMLSNDGGRSKWEKCWRSTSSSSSDQRLLRFLASSCSSAVHIAWSRHKIQVRELHRVSNLRKVQNLAGLLENLCKRPYIMYGSQSTEQTCVTHWSFHVPLHLYFPLHFNRCIYHYFQPNSKYARTLLRTLWHFIMIAIHKIQDIYYRMLQTHKQQTQVERSRTQSTEQVMVQMLMIVM